MYLNITFPPLTAQTEDEKIPEVVVPVKFRGNHGLDNCDYAGQTDVELVKNNSLNLMSLKIRRKNANNIIVVKQGSRDTLTSIPHGSSYPTPLLTG